MLTLKNGERFGLPNLCARNYFAAMSRLLGKERDAASGILLGAHRPSALQRENEGLLIAGMKYSADA